MFYQRNPNTFNNSTNQEIINNILSSIKFVISTKDPEIKSITYAQKSVVIINLGNLKDKPIIEGMQIYDLNTIDSPILRLDGIGFGSSYLKFVSVTDNNFNVARTVKIPVPNTEFQ